MNSHHRALRRSAPRHRRIRPTIANCPSCGSENDPHVTYCRSCGRSVGAGSIDQTLVAERSGANRRAKRSSAGVLALLGVGTAGIAGGILLASILGDDGGNGGAAVPSTVANTPSVEAEQASVPLTADVSESSVAARALNPLFNASFETSGGWYPNFKRSAVTATVRSVPDARDGDFVLGVSTTEPEGSIAQDVRLGPVDGETITFTVQVRSSQDGAQLAGILAIWLLAAGDAHQQPASGLSEFTRFTASSDWETVTYSITAQEHHPEGIVRAEVYLQTEGVELFVDDARLSVG